MPFPHLVDLNTTLLREAALQLAVTVFIRRYLSTHPAHATTTVARDLLRWADALEADGLSRLESAGRQHAEEPKPPLRVL